MTEQDNFQNVQENITENIEQTPNQSNKGKYVAGAAAAAAGLVAGAGAAYAASNMGTDTPIEEPVEDPTKEIIQEPAKQTSQTSSHSHVAKTEPAPNPTEKFFEHNEVEVNSIETMTNENGEGFHVAEGTVNGHEAAFIDNGEGKIEGAIVDINDNTIIEPNEYIDLSNTDMTMGDLAQHLSDGDAPVVIVDDPVIIDDPTPEPDVTVIAVENDVVLEGEVVDVAALTVDETPVILVDANQDGEANILMADANASGSFEENEIEDVTDSHIAMPTTDDVDPTFASTDADTAADMCLAEF